MCGAVVCLRPQARGRRDRPAAWWRPAAVVVPCCRGACAVGDWSGVRYGEYMVGSW